MSPTSKLGQKFIIRAFRAPDDPKACKLFAMGHEHLLRSVGVEKISSSGFEWADNLAVFVIVIESSDRTRVYGGLRVHIADKVTQLPIEKAVGDADPTLGASIALHNRASIGEICGLWNSLEAARYGVGSNLLARAVVAISTRLNLTRLIVLTAPYVINMVEDLGFIINRTFGRNGEFIYPRPDMIATLLINDDLDSLASAREEEREAVVELRNNPEIKIVENIRGKNVELQYKLSIENGQFVS
ncbi:hypothetical protein ASE74_16030 [Pedobacter sp. Leaf216]|uniref:hypothetical protein n=1 Tax=Pedobacter sp. Leaf216 TaxID=1735684 RepID=UPI0006F445A9|nr:hypothetical protein [Pedobacter sp. Leaf216]KQM77907.1 hypothetical protein ASE74_16030 [Pedobacter sp. Leaf216]